jgi:hypothetical protein
MHIRYSTGQILEGIILSLTEDVARVAIKDWDDVAEFRMVAGRWISEEWEPVVFEFPSTSDSSCATEMQAPLWSDAAGGQAGSRYVN